MRKAIQKYRNRIFAVNKRRQKNFDSTIVKLEQIFQRINASPKTQLSDARKGAHLMIVAGTYTLDLYFLIAAMSAFSVTSGAIMIPGDGYGVLKPLFVLLFLVLAVFIPIVTSRNTYIFSLMIRIPLWQSRVIVVVISTLIVSYLTVWMSTLILGEDAISIFAILPPMFVLYVTAQFILHLRLAEYMCFVGYQKRHASTTIESLIPAPKRGKLLAMSARDHYVKILTDRGNHLHRLSMKEAVELAPENTGFLVHRSHWVAFTAIESFEKQADRQFIVLRNGAEIAVAKTKIDQVQAYLDSR